MLPAYFGTLTHTVSQGDSLFNIAKKYNTTIENILKFNDIPNINMIRTGQQIIVPMSPPESILYTVRPGDSLYNIALRHGTFVDNLIRFNYLNPPYIIYPGQQLIVTASLK
ncbi:MAG: LysM peptidoglycan-binding domain-containing protein [Sedimentibacter saalensis]|uniref:LysM peptidoglycan-binding domain-containing protein n=1 Tax=Sedimentibacter saalensis TaxID=130788 RepID=UPI002B221213|nr:LysM peptidoglycan-binding domain-containing protein [Sedimentibacter saalensis]MEA5096297.1 LysM peptidoglycan-binding domain-containing protein [Sedimentibacter saalensis]